MITNFKNFLLGILCLSSISTFSQPFNNAINSPSIPSAAAMNYGKQAEINTNFYTGAAGYNLPLCGVSDATVSHTVSINYNSSFRVGEIASNIGLGFHLAAGGLVTRTILSLEDDDDAKGFYYHGSTLNSNHFGDAASGDRDSESDIYTFSVGGMVGKFIFDNTQNIKMLPQSDIKVTVVKETDDTFKGFKIQSPDGMIYHFGYHPTDPTVSVLEYTTINNEEQLSSWMLTRIESFDTKHGIDFEYVEQDYEFRSLPYCTRTKYDNGSGIQTTPACSDIPIETVIEGPIIHKIITPTKTITFNHFSRLDLKTDFRFPKGINQVKVETGDFCYQYDFTQDYFVDLDNPSTGNKRLRLDSIQKMSCDMSDSEPVFTFDYYGIDNPDGTPFFPHILDKNRDHWDFYNFRYDVNVAVRTDNNDFDDIIPSANAFPNNGNITYTSDVVRSSYYKAQLIGGLKRINLPTKGWTEIEYESNEYFKFDNVPTYLLTPEVIASCNCNCDGNTSNQQTVTIPAASLANGQWQLCIEPIVDDIPGCSPLSPHPNNSVQMKVYKSSTPTLPFYISPEFDSSTPDCIEGDIAELGNKLDGNIQAGESYIFEVLSKDAKATLSLFYYTNGDDHLAGGLRVKKTTTYDGSLNSNLTEDHSRDIIRTYEYKDADNPTRSSGVLFNQPKYAFSLNEHSVLFTSSSVFPLSSFSGYHIGYSNTIIKENGNGSQQFRFYMEDSTEVYDDYPIEPVPIRVEAGVLAEQNIMLQNGTVESSSSILRSDDEDYDDYNYVSGFTFKAQKVPTYNGSTLVNEFTHHIIYQPRTGLFLPGTVTTSKDGVSNTTAYEYHDIVIAPDVIRNTNSDGKETEQQFDYSIDHSSNFYRADFEATNRIAIPLESRVLVEGIPLDGSRTTFAFFDANGDNPNEIFLIDGILRPYKTLRFERTWEGGQLFPGLWNIQEYLESYTDDGMLESWRKPHWGFSETYNYQNRLLTSKTYLEFTDSTEYYPNNSSLVKKVIAVDGTSKSMTYDDLLRPKTVTDDCKNIVTTFDYYFTTGGLDKNYVKTTTDYPIPNGNSQLDILENFVYKDGIGRTIATVRKGQGPDSANDDIISAVEFDNQGRPFKKYEPQLLPNNNGAYQAPGASWKYSETTFYPSPLNRPQTTVAPDWFPTTYEYGHNEIADGITIDSTATGYDIGELFKQTIIDANDHKSITFTDKKGRVILSRRTDNSETTSLNYDTKYIYDDKDRRVYTLPPGTDINQKDLLFFCEYDREDRKYREYHPGKAEMNYRYNNQDLLIARRDGYIEEHQDYTYYVYQYDQYGREIKSGFYDSNLITQDYGIDPTTPLVETIYGTAAHEKDKVKTVRTKILNGGNDWLETTNTYSTCALLIRQESNNHINLALESETTSIFYDGADNPVNITYDHVAHGNSFRIETTETIDYAGRARNSLFQANSSLNYTINSKFYDEKEQLIQKLQGKTGFGGGQAWLQQCDYNYLENGLLKSINSDNLTGTQLPFLNCPNTNTLPNPGLPNLTNLDNKDLFYLELAYDTPFAGTSALAQKNGNITGVKWQVRGREKQGFSLQYDLYNRLSNADYFDENGANVVDESGIFDVDMTYDQRGNINTLSRYGLTPLENCFEPELIDQLDYTYADSNHLAIVTDGAPCPDNKYIQPTIDNSELHAVNTKIEADNLINSSVEVVYQAGQEISLMPGFRVPAGMGFIAKIGPCPLSGYETGGYTQKNTNTNRYDINGNLELDPQKSITNTFNHLDLPTLITLEDGKSITFTYDAAGTLLAKVLKDKDGVVLETRDYIGGVEYVDGTLESIYHSEGRLHYVDGIPQMEYTTTDHLGNTRLSYADLNNNGVVQTPSEILDEVHYYPNGLKMEGYWMNSDKFRYTFNSIEEIDDFGLNVNRATFRTLDPELGRWWSVDPQATSLMGLSPYNSMNLSPAMYNDPDGDLGFLASVGIGAGISVLTNGINNGNNDQGFFQGAGQAAFWGGVSAGSSFGIGEIFGSTGSFANELGRAVTHGVSSGIFSELSDGSFGSGFLSGAVSSGLSSGANALGVGNVGMIGIGGLSGGIGAVIAGGNFFDGFRQGLITTGLNHVVHNTLGGNPDPPTKEEIKYYLATEFDAGRLTRQDYLNAIVLIEEGNWGLAKQVLWNNKTDIALTVGGAGLLRILSKTRLIKSGVLVGKNNFRIQFGNEFGSYLPGKVKGSIQGGAKTFHINFGKTHIYLNPKQWGKMTSHWWKPWR